MVNVSVKNIASKVGGGKGMCVKWEEGSPTSFVMMASAIIKTLHQNTAKTSLRFKTIKLFPGNRPPRSPYFIINPAATPLPHQLLLYGCKIQPKGQAREYQHIFSFFFFLEGVRGGGGSVGVLTEQQIHLSIQNAENFLKGSLDFDNFLGEDRCPTTNHRE